MSVNQLVQDFNDFNCIQDKALKEILLDNEDTRIGKNYQFSQISNIYQYQEAVPLSTYEDYRLGNHSSYPAVATLVTSGSTGHKKSLLITEKALKQYSSYIYEMPIHLVGGKKGLSLHTSVFHQEDPTILSSAYYHYLWKQGALDPKHFVEGEKLLFSNESFCVYYVKLRLALLEENLTSIQSIYLYEILLMLDYLAKNWQMILRDIESQSFSIELPNTIQKELLAKKYSPKRLSQVKQVLIKYAGKPPLKVLWSKLAYISGIGQQNAYDVERLKAYLKDIPIYYFAYASTECMAGIATTFNEASYTLLPHSAFYEFLDENNAICLAKQLKKNQTYELIVTTYSGLYRYRTFDRLKFMGYEGQSPRFKILGRTNRLLNIAGEKVDEWSVQEAFHQVLRRLNMQSCPFYIGIDQRVLPARYVVFVVCLHPLEEMNPIFDQALMKLNPNYKKLRALNRIDLPYFKHLKGTPSFIKENQKPRRILKEEEVEQIDEETTL